MRSVSQIFITFMTLGFLLIPGPRLSAQFIPFSFLKPSTTAGCLGTPWGNVSHGYSNTAYSNSTPAGPCTSVDQTRLCINGSLSGSFTNTTCTNGCSGQTVNWTISSKSCSTTAPALAHGGSTTVTDSTNPITGTRNVSCNNGALNNSGGSCAQACGGFLYQGYCYYLGGPGQSCNAACSGRGGCNVNGVNHIGINGTDAKCDAVLSALGKTTPAVFSNAGGGYGCYTDQWSSVRVRGIFTSTCVVALASLVRTCACNN